MTIETAADAVTMFCKSPCLYCVKAKDFLAEHRIPFTAVELDATTTEGDAAQRDALVQQTDHHTFPFIFVGHTFVGGYAELVHAHATLKLHELLQSIGVSLDADF